MSDYLLLTQITLHVGIIIGVLIIQYFLAMTALMRLFKSKPKLAVGLIWNIIIVLIIIIGPIGFFIYQKNKKEKLEQVEEITEDNSADYSI